MIKYDSPRLGKLALVCALLAAPLALPAATLTYSHNNGSGGITINGVTQYGFATGDFWYNTRWYDQSPVINPSGSIPAANTNLYAPSVIKNVWAWNAYYGGWEDSSVKAAGDEIFLSVTTGGWNAWSAPTKVISHGDYWDVNDPSVAKVGSAWKMLYTVHAISPADRTWIGYSTSSDGGSWSPSAASLSHEIGMADPSNKLGGTLESIARPALIRKGSEWWMYADYQLTGSPALSVLVATCTDTTFPNFTVVAKIPNDADGWPTLIEADVWTDSGGTMHALYRKNWEIWKASSTDGLTWTGMAPVLKSSYDPAADYDASPTSDAALHNPGVVYDPATNELVGVMYGASPNGIHGGPGGRLSEAKVHMAFPQYKFFAYSNSGTVGHTYGTAPGRDSFRLDIGAYPSYHRIVITDPVTNAVLIDQDGLSGVPGDVYNFSP